MESGRYYGVVHNDARLISFGGVRNTVVKSCCNESPIAYPAEDWHYWTVRSENLFPLLVDPLITVGALGTAVAFALLLLGGCRRLWRRRFSLIGLLLRLCFGLLTPILHHLLMCLSCHGIHPWGTDGVETFRGRYVLYPFQKALNMISGFR